MAPEFCNEIRPQIQTRPKPRKKAFGKASPEPPGFVRYVLVLFPSSGYGSHMPNHVENLEPADPRDLNYGSRFRVQARPRSGKEGPVQMHHCDGDPTRIAKFGCAGLTESDIKQETQLRLRMGGEAHKTYEIRCPVYGFVGLNDWEWQIISQPAYQRLRRIRQLAWTDYVFPGAMHTRFEHSLGVMHMASMLYDGIVERSRAILQSELGYKDEGLTRHRVLVRLAALLHDVGHSPFSHAAEDLFPAQSAETTERYEHEQYSAAIVRRHFADVIKGHPLNMNYGFSADDVADLLDGEPSAGGALFWRDLISGQLDADRMDYLLRDSLHTGVGYGRYDWHRLVHTTVALPQTQEEGGPKIGVEEGGWHAAEGLIIARYLMFTQVYFHKTRVIYDFHLQGALADLLPGGRFPKPTNEELDSYLQWDDWRVLGLLADGKGGEGGRRLANRNHYREIAHTPETPTPGDLERLDKWKEALAELLAAEIPAEKSWYKTGPADVQILTESPKNYIKPLSAYSSVVKNIAAVRGVRLYVRPESRDQALSRLQNVS